MNAFKLVKVKTVEKDPSGSEVLVGNGETTTSLTTYIRYRILPVQGTAYLTEDELKTKSSNYLFDELLLPRGDGDDGVSSGGSGGIPLVEPIEFTLVAQLADLEAGDITHDNTAKWPETREVAELGLIRLEKVLDREESEKLAKEIIFDPIPRSDVQGVEPSDDPLLDLRAGVYLISGRERRAA